MTDLHTLTITVTLDGDRKAELDVPYSKQAVSPEEAVRGALECAASWADYFADRLTRPLDASLPNG